MKTPKTIALVLLGAAVGFVAAAWAPNLSVRPAHAAGSWTCAISDKFPDVQAARGWRGAAAVEQGMNKLAPNATLGQVVSLTLAERFGDIICVKN